MPDPNPNEALDQLNATTRETLHYSRRRFLGTWLALASLAILTAVALWVAVDTAHTQNQVVHLSASNASHKAKTAQESSDQIVLYLQGKQGIPGVPGANGKDGAPGQPGSVPSELPTRTGGTEGRQGRIRFGRDSRACGSSRTARP